MTAPVYKLASLLSKQGTLRSKNPGINSLLQAKNAQPNDCEVNGLYDKTHNRSTYNKAYAKISL